LICRTGFQNDLSNRVSPATSIHYVKAFAIHPRFFVSGPAFDAADERLGDGIVGRRAVISQTRQHFHSRGQLMI
jgi:hypothetical protein